MPDNTEPHLQSYAAMQRSYYDKVGADNPRAIVGNYDFQENFPYESLLLFKHGDIRKPIFEDFAKLRAFDIACGEGRMVRRLKHFFAQVDGADISASMVEHARRNTPDSEFWVTSGLDAGGAPTAAYDFIFCTISLQHICVFETRDQIFADLVRLLKPSGKATFQMLFSKHFPLVPTTEPTALGPSGVQLYRIDSHHARWFDNKTDATVTNSGCDVVIGTGELDTVKNYFLRYFKNVEFWFHDISIGRGWGPHPAVLPNTHPNSHLNNDYWGTHFIFIHCEA